MSIVKDLVAYFYLLEETSSMRIFFVSSSFTRFWVSRSSSSLAGKLDDIVLSGL